MRRAGILLHPTSLPGPFGVGDLGPAADRWLDGCEAAGITLWRVLPLGPTSHGDSPYGTLSAVAGIPLLFSPESGPAGGPLETRTRTNKVVLVDGPTAWIGSYLRVRLTGTTGSTFTGVPGPAGKELAIVG